MKIENKSNNIVTGNCPLCHKHCPLSDPHCGKGRKYLQQNINQEITKTGKKEKKDFIREEGELTVMEADGQLIPMLQRCSHLLLGRKGRHHGQGRVLAILLEKGDMTQRELMELIQVRSSSLSELLVKLEGDGYITRVKSEEDKRNLNIHLTEKGTETAQRYENSKKEFSADIADILNEEEVKQLEDLLSKLIIALDVKNSQESCEQRSDEKEEGHHQKHGKKKDAHKHHGNHGKKKNKHHNDN